MGYIGVSLILASFVWVIVAPPPWIHPFMPPFLLAWRNDTKLLPPSSRSKSSSPPPPSDQHESKTTTSTTTTNGHASEPSTKEQPRNAPPPPTLNLPEGTIAAPAPGPAPRNATAAAVAMPPPPPPPAIHCSSPNPAIPAPPMVTEPETEEQTTPKATPAAPAASVPSFTLEEPSKAPAPPSLGASLSSPSGSSLGKGSMPPPPPPSTTSANMMPPPAPTPRGPVPPRLAAFPAMNSPQRARGPVPNRGPAPGSSSSLGSSLAPPPTHSAKAPKPTRKVILTPGHSPLDWARISGPNADLRNLPPSTPYLKVTPSMLKKMTGRKGKDAWMALGGRVYNISPYLPYHPAGEPELLRGAGRDATKLFGEIHPWVNYETMLSACLVGLLVDEEEGTKPSAMDEMD
ncbi:hypothetical protein CFIO01_04622 [Colletotrichum fioriniae PJ7]|uniref:Cytochrome b5 heme-binding domain-containing protein n=1 Tax=Colletotrichum fioriniae PJ7 TaxID=1445577 RepID=A0A010RD42_9PEZI|nr:hypothetical protein CFIO01_04622 [Colletotrichum fioriniae PJ7]